MLAEHELPLLTITRQPVPSSEELEQDDVEGGVQQTTPRWLAGKAGVPAHSARAGHTVVRHDLSWDVVIYLLAERRLGVLLGGVLLLRRLGVLPRRLGVLLLGGVLLHRGVLLPDGVLLPRGLLLPGSVRRAAAVAITLGLPPALQLPAFRRNCPPSPGRTHD
jgi:hypothetical protein